MPGTELPEWPEWQPGIAAGEDRHPPEDVSALTASQRTKHAVGASEARYRKALEVTQEALASAEALYRVVSSMAAAESLDSLLQRIVDTIAETLPADRVNLFAFDVERDPLRIQALHAGPPGAQGAGRPGRGVGAGLSSAAPAWRAKWHRSVPS